MLKKEIPMLKVVSFHHIIRFEYPGHPADYIVNFYIILDYLYLYILKDLVIQL